MAVDKEASPLAFLGVPRGAEASLVDLASRPKETSRWNENQSLLRRERNEGKLAGEKKGAKVSPNSDSFYL